MKVLQSLKEKYRDLFVFLQATEVHPHDQLMAKTVLKIVPDFVTPNQITAMRVLSTPMVFFLILNGDYSIGAFTFLVVAFTDAMDGSLARTRNKITKFGMMFDPLADKFLIGSMVLLLVFKYFNFWLGITILIIEIIFIVSASISTMYLREVKQANNWGKIKMFLQVLAVFITLLALLLEFPALFGIASWIFGLAIGFAILSLFTHGV